MIGAVCKQSSWSCHQHCYHWKQDSCWWTVTWLLISIYCNSQDLGYSQTSCHHQDHASRSSWSCHHHGHVTNIVTVVPRQVPRRNKRCLHRRLPCPFPQVWSQSRYQINLNQDTLLDWILLVRQVLIYLTQGHVSILLQPFFSIAKGKSALQTIKFFL